MFSLFSFQWGDNPHIYFFMVRYPDRDNLARCLFGIDWGPRHLIGIDLLFFRVYRAKPWPETGKHLRV